jgi:hypothetical protein
MLSQVVYTLGNLEGACMESEETLVASFRVRRKVERNGDNHYYPGCQAVAGRCLSCLRMDQKSRKVPGSLCMLQM